MKPLFATDITTNKSNETPNGKELGIYFPCYELDTLTRLTSLSASESDL